jgi:hypothetical protein
VKHTLRFTGQSLEVLLRVARVLIQRFLTERWFPRMSPDQVASFWSAKGMVDNDWDGLTRDMLSSVFSSEVRATGLA